jgi:CelD/BcsL family acetyltransferase involved in cellulose biosynthesis
MRRIRLDSITPREEDAWRDLAADAVEANVFFEAQYVLAAARAFGVESEVSLLVDESDGAWNGCLPVHEKRVLGYPAIVAAWKHPYSFLGTPLVRRGRTEEFATALMRAVGTRQAGVLLSLREVAEGPVSEAIRAAQNRSADVVIVQAESAERAALERTGRPVDEIVDTVRPGKSRRRHRRSLAKELAQPDLTRRTRPGDAEAVEKFLELEAASWKGDAGTAMACDRRSAEFFRTICASLAAEDRVFFRSLDAGDRVTAMTCEIAAGDVLFGFKTAFDEELARHSPGTLLQIDNYVAFAEGAPQTLFDSCADPGNQTLNELLPDHVKLWSLVFARRDLRGRLAGRLLAARAEVRRRRA